MPTSASSDEARVKFSVSLALTAALAAAESHPSWWIYASPDATALVGIQWDNLRHSPFAAAIEAELSATGTLAFPDLDCLKHGPRNCHLLAGAAGRGSGKFPCRHSQGSGPAAGAAPCGVSHLTLWVPDQAAKLGVAQISEQLVLVGTRKTLQGAIDRSLLETGRQYSPLLPRAARFSQSGDLWVVALKLPDPLASLFVPLDADGRISGPGFASRRPACGSILRRRLGGGGAGVRSRLAEKCAILSCGGSRLGSRGRTKPGRDPTPGEFRKSACGSEPSRVARGISGAVAAPAQTAATAPAPRPVAVPVPPVAATVPPPAPPALAEIAAASQPPIVAALSSVPPLPPPAPAPVTFEVTHTENSQPQIIPHLRPGRRRSRDRSSVVSSLYFGCK